MSVLDFLHLGSSLSLRSFSRVGSTVSVLGVSRFGSSMSVLDFLHLGSSLSLRQFARLGSSVSLYGTGQFRLGDSTLKYSSSLPTATGSTAAGLELYLGSTRSFSASTVGGTLHGMWASDATISTSDRRLKKNIEPVTSAIARDLADRGMGEDPDSLSWLLRALRPVAYKFNRGPESKYQRYGFIADEVEALLPDLARELPSQGANDDAEPEKGLVYTDLIAVLVAQLQAHEARFTAHEARFETHEQRIARLEAHVAALEARCP